MNFLWFVAGIGIGLMFSDYEHHKPVCPEGSTHAMVQDGQVWCGRIEGRYKTSYRWEKI